MRRFKVFLNGTWIGYPLHPMLTDMPIGAWTLTILLNLIGRMREKQPRLLVIWGKYDLLFDLSEPQAYRRDVPTAEVHVLDAGHFALDTTADEIAALVRGFVSASP